MKASALERGGLTAQGVAPLPTEGSLEERLKALQPNTWQREFCGGRGGKAGGKEGGRQTGGAAGERPPGSPSLLLVSPSAIGAVNLIKLCPQFNKVRAVQADASRASPAGPVLATPGAIGSCCPGQRALRAPSSPMGRRLVASCG